MSFFCIQFSSPESLYLFSEANYLGRLMVNKLYTNEFHVKMQTNLNTDLRGYTSLKTIIKKPSGTTLEKFLTVVDALKGIVFFLTAVGDFDEVGTYYTQIELSFFNATYLSDTVSFVVNDDFT